MAAVNEVSVPGLNSIIGVLTPALWGWIHDHMDTDVFTVRIWVVRKTFKVRDLLPFAELLLGKDPIVAP